MKKVILAAICVIVNLVMVSCSNDDETTTTPSSKINKTDVLGKSGGQNSPINPPRPPRQ